MQHPGHNPTRDGYIHACAPDDRVLARRITDGLHRGGLDRNQVAGDELAVDLGSLLGEDLAVFAVEVGFEGRVEVASGAPSA